MRKLIFLFIAILALSFTANAQRYTKYVFEPANAAWYSSEHQLWETDLKYGWQEIEILSYKVTMENGREVGERIPLEWTVLNFDNRCIQSTKMGNTLIIELNFSYPAIPGCVTNLKQAGNDRYLDIWSWFPGANPY